MLGIGRPDRHALPRITLVENCADHDACSLPRERVRCVPGMLNSSEVKVLYPT
jgi:hypothetical protein